MKLVAQTIPAFALIVAACGSPTAQTPTNGGATANQAGNAMAPATGNAGTAASGPLTSYEAHLPSDEVGGVTFLNNPLVRSAVEAAVADADVRRWVLRADVTSSPIGQREGRLVATGCESHNCGPHNWSILIDAAGTSAEVCYVATSDSGSATWYAAGRPGERRPGSCPRSDGQ